MRFSHGDCAIIINKESPYYGYKFHITNFLPGYAKPYDGIIEIPACDQEKLGGRQFCFCDERNFDKHFADPMIECMGCKNQEPSHLGLFTEDDLAGMDWS